MALTAEQAEERMLEWGLRPVEPYPGRLVLWRVECVECGQLSSVAYRKAQNGWRCRHENDPVLRQWGSTTCLGCGVRYPRNDSGRLCPTCKTRTHKECRSCRRVLPVEEYRQKVQAGRTYLRSECRECSRARRASGVYVPVAQPVSYPTEPKVCRDCQVVKPAVEFGLDRRTADGLAARCKDCTQRRKREAVDGLSVEEVEAFRARKAGSTAKDPLKKKADRLAVFHLTLTEYERRLAEQQHLCAVCGEPERSGHGEQVWDLAVDHDHRCCPERARSCGKCVRGLLCSRCNQALGFFGDDVVVMRRAVEYLRLWDARFGKGGNPPPSL